MSDLAMPGEGLKEGIFSLIISLTQYRAKVVGMENAKTEVADWLSHIASNLKGEMTDGRS